MKTTRPTINVVVKTQKKRKDGLSPLYIHVNWQMTRAEESTGVYINEKELNVFQMPEEIKKRLKELEMSSKELMNERMRYLKKGIKYNFTAKDVLSYVPKNNEIDDDSYKIYIHILPNNSIYIGQTSKKLNDRWQNGEGYKENKLFYYNIKKYGWENIHHLLYKEGLTQTEANIIEKDLIDFYSNNEIATGRVVLNLNHNKKRKES